MVKEINADIFEQFKSYRDGVVLCHQCNCFTTMGSGIAAKIKELYPSAYEADLKTVRGDKNKLGTFSWSQVGPGMYIANIYGQFDYGRDTRKTNYEAVYNGLSKILKFCGEKSASTVLIPYKMSSNLAGGDFRIIRVMIDVIFENFNGNVYICNLENLGYVRN